MAKTFFMLLTHNRPKIWGIFFALLLILSTAFLFGYFYSSYQKELTEEWDSYQRQFERGIENTEEEFDQLKAFANQLSEVGWFRRLLYSDHQNKEITKEAYDLHENNSEIKTYTLLNPFIENAFVYFPGREYILSSLGLLYDEEIPERIFKVKNISQEEWQELLTSRNTYRLVPNVQVRVQNRDEEGILWITSYPFSNIHIRANLVMFITDDKLEEQFETGLTENGGELYLFHLDELVWTTDLDAAFKFGEIPETDQKFLRVKDGIWSAGSGRTDRYFLYLPEEKIAARFQADKWILYVLLFAVLSLGAASLLLRFLYRPLQDILRSAGMTGEKGENTITRYRDLEREVALLVGREKELQRKLENQKPFLMNDVLRTFLYGKGDNAEFEKLRSLLGVTFSHQCYQILVIRGCQDYSMVSLNKIAKQLTDDTKIIYYIYLKDEIVFLVNADKRDTFAGAEQRIWQKMKEQKTSGRMMGGAGGIVLHIPQISRSFQEALENLSYYYFLEGQSGFIGGEFVKDRSGQAPWDDEKTGKMLERMKKGEEGMALEELENLFEEVQAEKKLTLEAAKDWLQRLCAELQKASEDLGCPELAEGLLCEGQGYREGKERIYRAVQAVSRYVSQKYLENTKGHFEKIIRYVDERMYDPELSLQMIADHFGYTTAYISRIFKEYFKKNFLNYVISHRIDKAKELLSKGGLSVKEVAESAGFNSDMAFRRVFKKETGMNPSNYRNLYGRDKE